MRIAFLMLLFVSTGAAAGWTEVDSDASVTYYIDPATISRDGNIATMRELLDYKTARVRDKRKYLSSVTRSEYDCKEERSRTLTLSLHSGNMGAGKTVHTSGDSDKWKPVAPGGATEALWKIACGRGHC